MTRLILAVALLAMFCFTPICRAEQYDNPSYANWSKFNVGSSETIEWVLGDGENKTTMDEVDTLKEKTDDYIVIETVRTVTVHGTSTPRPTKTAKLPAKLDKPSPETVVGEEKVEIDGKTYDCKVVSISVAKAYPGAPNMTLKKWICADVPGGIVKIDSTGPRDPAWLLKSFEAK